MEVADGEISQRPVVPLPAVDDFRANAFAKMMENGLRREHALILLIAALQGAAGVTLAAMAAHVEASANLATASQFLMVARLRWTGARRSGGHAVDAATRADLRDIRAAAGVTLFSADLALRALGSGKPFHMPRQWRNHDDFELGRPRGLAMIRLVNNDRDHGA